MALADYKIPNINYVLKYVLFSFWVIPDYDFFHDARSSQPI
jgi:hypothetical protein